MKPIQSGDVEINPDQIVAAFKNDNATWTLHLNDAKEFVVTDAEYASIKA